MRFLSLGTVATGETPRNINAEMMTAQGRQCGMFMGQVVRQRTPCRGHFEITIAVEGFPRAEPGQFLQVRCHPPFGGAEPMRQGGRDSADVCCSYASPRSVLRRPFSIAGLRRIGARGEIDLLGRVVGMGTAWLATLSPGASVDILGPLGRGFSTPASGKHVLLMAGGVGLPPIRWLGEELRNDGVICDLIYGARTRDALLVTLIEEPSTTGALTSCVEAFGRGGVRASITTDDGTCGLRGRVTERAVSYFDACEDLSSVQVYACGPEPMLRVVGSLCVSRGVDCELVLERMMGCGMGTCQSCVVRVVDESSEQGWRYALCCTEGPVFEASRVIWP